jgi:hypothetical protein
LGFRSQLPDVDSAPKIPPSLALLLIPIASLSLSAWHRWFDVERFEVTLLLPPVALDIMTGRSKKTSSQSFSKPSESSKDRNEVHTNARHEVGIGHSRVSDSKLLQSPGSLRSAAFKEVVGVISDWADSELPTMETVLDSYRMSAFSAASSDSSNERSRPFVKVLWNLSRGIPDVEAYEQKATGKHVADAGSGRGTGDKGAGQHKKSLRQQGRRPSITSTAVPGSVAPRSVVGSAMAASHLESTIADPALGSRRSLLAAEQVGAAGRIGTPSEKAAAKKKSVLTDNGVPVTLPFVIVRINAFNSLSPDNPAPCSGTDANGMTETSCRVFNGSALIIVNLAFFSCPPPMRMQIIASLKKAIETRTVPLADTAMPKGALSGAIKDKSPSSLRINAFFKTTRCPISRILVSEPLPVYLKPRGLAAASLPSDVVPPRISTIQPRAVCEEDEDELAASLCCGGTSIPQRLLRKFLWHRRWRFALTSGASSGNEPGLTYADRVRAGARLVQKLASLRLEEGSANGRAEDGRPIGVNRQTWDLVAWDLARLADLIDGAPGLHQASQKDPKGLVILRAHFARAAEVALLAPPEPAVLLSLPASAPSTDGKTAEGGALAGASLKAPASALAALGPRGGQNLVQFSVLQQEIRLLCEPDLSSDSKGTGATTGRVDVEITFWMEPMEARVWIQPAKSSVLSPKFQAPTVTESGGHSLEGGAERKQTESELETQPLPSSLCVSSRGLYSSLCTSLYEEAATVVRGEMRKWNDTLRCNVNSHDMLNHALATLSVDSAAGKLTRDSASVPQQGHGVVSVPAPPSVACRDLEGSVYIPPRLRYTMNDGVQVSGAWAEATIF